MKMFYHKNCTFCLILKLSKSINVIKDSRYYNLLKSCNDLGYKTSASYMRSGDVQLHANNPIILSGVMFLIYKARLSL